MPVRPGAASAYLSAVVWFSMASAVLPNGVKDMVPKLGDHAME